MVDRGVSSADFSFQGPSKNINNEKQVEDLLFFIQLFRILKTLETTARNQQRK